MKKLLLFLFITLFAAFQLNATPKSSVAGAVNWNTAASWSPSGVPGSGDDVTIISGSTVTVNTTGSCNSITINAPATANGISISSPNSLTVTGAITMNSPTATVNSTIAVGTGTLSAASITIPGSGTGSRNCIVSVSTGIINVAGNITFSGTAAQAQLTFTGAGTLNLGGTIGSGGTFAPSTGTVNYNAAGAQIVAVYTYNSLNLSNSGTKTAGGNLVVNGTLTTSSSVTLDMSTSTLTGTLGTITNGGTIKTSSIANPPLTASKTWGGLIEYSTSGQSVPAGTYNNLQFDNSSGTNTAVGNLVVNGALTITGGTLDMSTFSLTGILATITNGGTIKTSSTTNPPLSSGETWGGTIEYARLTGGQYIPTGTYSTLKLDNTSGNNTILGSITVNTTLNGLTTSGLIIGTNLTLTLSNSIGNQCGPISYSTVNLTLTYAGNSYLNCGTITYGSSGCHVNFTGTGSINCSGNAAFASSSGNQLTVGAGTFICSGTIGQSSCSSSEISCTSGSISCSNITVGSGTTISCTSGTITCSNLTSSSGNTISYGTGTININGSFTNGSSLNWSPGTGIFNYGGGAQIVLNQMTYINLTLSGTGTKTTTGVSVNGILSIEGDNTVALSTPPTLGGSSTIQYKGTGSRTTTVNEFPNAFAGSGGLIIDQGVGNTITLNANKTALTNINIKSGTLYLPTSITANRASAGGALTITGTLKLGGTTGGQTGSNFPTNFSALTLTGGTVEYSVAAGGQTIYSTPAYNNLTLDNTSASNTAGNNLTVNGILTTTAGGTLDMSTFTLTGTLATITNGGTIKTSCLTNPPFASGINWGTTGTIEYALNSQFVPAGTYFNLKFDNTTGTNTAVGNLVVNGTLTTFSNGIMDMGANTLAGTLAAIANAGTIKTSNLSGAPIPTGNTWGGTVNYANLSGSQTIMPGIYAILTLSNTSGTNTANGNLSTTTLNNITGGILDMVGFTLSGAINNSSSKIKFNGASNGLAISTGTVEYYGTSQTVASGTYSTLTISASGTKTAANNLAATTLNNTGGAILDMVGFTLSVSGTIANTGSTIKFNGASNGFVISTGTVEYYGTTQTVAGGTYSTLTISASGTKTAANNLAATTLNNTGGAILDMAGFTLSVSGIITNTGATIKFNGASNGLAISTGTVEYYGASQTVQAGNYNNITISTSGTKTLAGATFAAGAFTINSGAALDANTWTITITGTGLAWNNSGNFIYGTSTVKMQGSVAQSMFGSTFYNLEINNPAGVTLTTSDIVTNQLTLTSGQLILNGNTMTLNSPAVLAGNGGNALSNFNNSSSNYIVSGTGDYLVQYVDSSDVIYPIGTASSFTPATLNNSGGHPDNYGVYVVTSIVHTIDAAGVVNKQWTIQEDTAIFSNLILSFQWNTSDEGLGFQGATTASVASLYGNHFDIVDSGLAISGINPRWIKMNQAMMVNCAGDSARTYAIGNPNSALPVELSTFASAVNGRNISLNWETKTEKNSDRFVIERTKTDAAAVTLNWESVTSVKAAVLSNSPKKYSFTDKNLQSGIYQYRLKMIDNDGSFAYSKIVEADITLPKNFELSQNYPNPFNPTTKINYSLPNDSKVTLEVYNIIGERVAQLVNQEQSAGYYVVNFGTSSNNITSGIYIYKLSAADNTGKNFSSIKKMMLLK